MFKTEGKMKFIAATYFEEYLNDSIFNKKKNSFSNSKDFSSGEWI
jgi:hypothetical protein